MHFTSLVVAAAALLAPVSSHTIGRRAPATGLAPRAELANCNSTQTPVLERAYERAHSLATAASEAALSGDEATFELYFKTKDQEVRKAVSERFAAIAEETKSTTGGKVQQRCSNEGQECAHGMLAYASSDKGQPLIVNCPAFYVIVEQSDGCGGQDHALVIIHELTHLDAVYSPAAEDLAYSHNYIMDLDATQAPRNADTFLHYAQGKQHTTSQYRISTVFDTNNCFTPSAVRLGCKEGDVEPIPEWLEEAARNGETEKPGQQG